MIFQVFDLTEEAPDEILHRLYGNLEKRESMAIILQQKFTRDLD